MSQPKEQKDPGGPTSLYRYFGEHGVLLYVGITSSMHTRFVDHSKGAKWHREVKHLTVEHFETRKEALDSEAAAIKKERPKYNITHNARSSNVPSEAHRERLRASVKAVVDKAPPLTDGQVSRLQALLGPAIARAFREGPYVDWT